MEHRHTEENLLRAAEAVIRRARDTSEVTSRAIAATFGPGGVGMWTTPLSASGLDPATHYISTGYIPAEFVAMSPMATWALDEDGNWVQTDYYPGDAAAVYGFCQQAGLPYTLAQIEGVLMMDPPPFFTMCRAAR